MIGVCQTAPGCARHDFVGACNLPADEGGDNPPLRQALTSSDEPGDD